MSEATRWRQSKLRRAGLYVTRTAAGDLLLESADQLAPHPNNLTDRLIDGGRDYPERIFIAKRDETGAWRSMSYGATLDNVRRLGQALLERGLGPERPLMIISGNDIEHAMLLLAGLYVGIPTASISSAYSLISEDYEKLRHAVGLLTPGMVFAADGDSYAKAIAAAVPDTAEVAVTRGAISARPATTYAALLDTRPTAAVERAHAAIGPQHIAKFMLTSGSTGLPKAVVVTHGMLTSNQQQILQTMPFLGEEPPVLLDWLPWNHTFGGNHNFGIVVYNGGTLYIDDGKPTRALMAETLKNLHEIAPTVYFNVPLGFEELLGALRADRALAANFFSRLKIMFFAAAALPHATWSGLDEIGEKTGGERIPMITGLGMTETAPAGLTASWLDTRPGEVGLPQPGLQLKLVPCGDKLELRYRGPNVTPGYWRQDQATLSAFDEEGFFCSGDALRFIDPADPDRGLEFDGRIAEDFKLTSGTFVSVGPLRMKVFLEAAPHLQEMVITGHNEDELGILIFPRFDTCCDLIGAAPGTLAPAEIVRHPAVRARFQALLARLAETSTGSANRIARAMLLVEPPSLDRGEITDKGSINQRAVLQARAELVRELYAIPASERVILLRNARDGRHEAEPGSGPRRTTSRHRPQPVAHLY